MTNLSTWDTIIIGAGAAGLFAAITAAERGQRTLLLEKNRRPGVKILMSGGTRCNLTNARGLRSLSAVQGPIHPAITPAICSGIRAIQAAFSPEAGRFLGPALKSFDVDSTIHWFEHYGLKTKIEENGKIFPASDKATDVLATLEHALRSSGATLHTNQPVTALDFNTESQLFLIQTPAQSYSAKSVILATGGKSFPGSGTTGDGYSIAAHFGHTIIPPYPALVPVVVSADWVRDLKGITLPDVLVKALNPSGQVMAQRREALLFAHFGLTGPAILDISRPLPRADSLKGWSLSIDLMPDTSSNAWEQHFIHQSRQGKTSVIRLLPDDLPNRLKSFILDSCAISPNFNAAELPKDKRHSLALALKELKLPVQGTLGFEKAEVTSGGVNLDEVNPKTLESRLQPGLYLIGEVLDIDGLIGGYNFQAAWSTGRLAGHSV